METDKIAAMITDLSVDLAPLVQEIENSAKTTQNHYGRYMSIIAQIGANQTNRQIVARALIGAGANVNGVRSAMRIHGI